jgi:hypothetical protein
LNISLSQVGVPVVVAMPVAAAAPVVIEQLQVLLLRQVRQ